MSSKYRSNRNVVFSCRYHVVWCPKYRRSVLVEGADEERERIVERVCLARDAELIELEVLPEHVHRLVDPQCCIHRLVKELKGVSSRERRAGFPFLKRRLPTLWTNSYFVSTPIDGRIRSWVFNACGSFYGVRHVWPDAESIAATERAREILAFGLAQMAMRRAMGRA